MKAPTDSSSSWISSFHILLPRFLFCSALTLLAGCTIESVTPDRKDVGYFQDTTINDGTTAELPSSENFKPFLTTPNLDHGAEHWFRYRLSNATPTNAKPRYLQIDFPNIDDADVYIQYGDSVVSGGRIGDDVAHSEWPVSTRLPTVAITRGDQIADAVFFKFKATGQPAVLPVSLIDQAAYVKRQQYDYLWYGIFFGATLGLILYNLLLYLNTKIVSYLAYVMYLSAFTLLQASITGLGQQFLWPTLANFTTYFALFLIAITNSLMAIFVTIFIELKQRQPKAYFLLCLIAIMSMVFPFGLLFLDYIYVQNVQYLFSFISMLTISVIAIIEWRRGSRPAVYLLTSYSVLFAGIIISLLYFSGVIAYSFFTTHLMEIAIIFEALVLAVGLADRINELKNAAQSLEHQSRLDQERFTRRLVSAHESEKQHFGAILHDDVGHQVLNLQYKISKFNEEEISLPDAAQKTLASFVDSTREILDDLRNLASTSHPHLLNKIGLSSAIDALLQRALVSKNISYSCNVCVDSSSQFVEQQLYRIVQELVSNTIKHANASEVLLNIIQKGDSIQFFYKDDGVGMSTETIEGSDSFGIVSIQERCKLIRGSLSFGIDQPIGMSCSIIGINSNG